MAGDVEQAVDGDEQGGDDPIPAGLWNDVGPPDDNLDTDAGDWLDQNAGNSEIPAASPPTLAGFPGSPGAMPAISDPWLSGFDGPARSPFAPGGVLRDIRQGLSMSLSLTGIYDSNPSRGFSNTGNDSGGDFSLMLGGGVSYQSRASTWTYSANYSGGYRLFFDQSDLNGYSQNAGASLNYTGGPLTAGLSLGMDFGSGANRNYESVTDTINIRYALNARYLISNKTSLQGDFSQSYSTASGQGNRDTGSFDAGLAGLWKYSPLTEFGPGIRYTRRTQDSGPVRTSIGPTFTVNYQLSGKVSLNSRVGMDFVHIDGEGSQDLSFSTAVGINYRASALWGMNLSLLRDNRASYTADGQFEEVTALRLGYNRKIRRASWGLGISWESTSIENNATSAANAANRESFSIDTSLGMPIFRDTTQANIFIGYRDEIGTIQSSNSFQIGFGLSRSF